MRDLSQFITSIGPKRKYKTGIQIKLNLQLHWRASDFVGLCLYWRLREFFGRKSTFFLIYVSKDSPCSCDHFHTKLLVVGDHLRRRPPKKHPN